MFRRLAINSEEFIFYLDLEGDFLKKKNLIKSLANFVKEKGKFNSATTFGFIVFQSDDNPITAYDELDFEAIISLLDEKWESREINRSLFENGLFEALSYVFRKSREARKNYRIIVISDTPSGLSDEYHTALYDLLIKARYFNTFIDIIRVGDKKFYEDDVKLKIISSETHGGVFYCNDSRLFQDILLSLVQNKSEFTVIQPNEQNPIKQEDRIFYEKLAVDLITLDQEDEEICDICELEMCPICETYSDEVHKCYNCNAKYHACCAAQYAIANPVGFRNLFRCVKCDTLLKLESEFVELIYKEDHEELEGTIEENVFEEQKTEKKPLIEAKEQPVIDELEPELKIALTADEKEQKDELKIDLPSPRRPPSLKHPPMPEEEQVFEKKVKIGGFFGQEITIKTKGGNNEKLPKVPETVISVASNNSQSSQPLSITSLKPPKKTTIKLCKICGATLSNIYICPICGAKLE